MSTRAPRISTLEEFIDSTEASFPKVTWQQWNFHALEICGLSPAWRTRFWNDAHYLQGRGNPHVLLMSPLEMSTVREGMRKIESGDAQMSTGAVGWNTIAELNNRFTLTGIGKILGWDNDIHPMFRNWEEVNRQPAASALAARYAVLHAQLELAITD